MGKYAGINKLMRRCLSDGTMLTLEKKYNQFQKKTDKFLYGFKLKEQPGGEKNPDKKFYIIGKEADKWGILTSYMYFMQECEWAIKHKYIPVIDMKNYFMPMSQDKNSAYKENAWDYYFRQPYPEYTLDEVYASKHVVKGNYDEYGFADTFNEYGIRSKDVVRYGSFVKKYVDFQPYLWERAKAVLKKYVPLGKRVLAVNMRAGYLWGQLQKEEIYNNHPGCLSLEEYIELTEKYMAQWKCDYVFVAVEDREWYEAFRTKFGGNFIGIERQRYRLFSGGQPVADERSRMIEYQGITVRRMTEDYLTEVCVVILCDCLLSSISSVSNIALLHNNNRYENVKIINSGLIHIK